MDSAGIEVRPIETCWVSSEFAEVFFDEVRVPVANPGGGREHDGWRVTNVTLSFEAGHRVRQREASTPAPGRRVAPLVHDATDRHELAIVLAQLDALWA